MPEGVGGDRVGRARGGPGGAGGGRGLEAVGYTEGLSRMVLDGGGFGVTGILQPEALGPSCISYV